VANGVRTILAEALKRRPGDISLEADLESGLGIDSMTMIDVSVSIEERFDIALPQFAAPGEIAVRTVGDLIAFIEKKVGEKTARGTT
jgi:acyl carrier protein